MPPSDERVNSDASIDDKGKFRVRMTWWLWFALGITALLAINDYTRTTRIGDYVYTHRIDLQYLLISFLIYAIAGFLLSVVLHLASKGLAWATARLPFGR
jgi:hypothetical protein